MSAFRHFIDTKDRRLYIVNRNNLKRIRIASGLKQSALAELAGVSRPAISDIERGKHLPSVKTARKLAKALKVKVEDIFEAD